MAILPCNSENCCVLSDKNKHFMQLKVHNDCPIEYIRFDEYQPQAVNISG